MLAFGGTNSGIFKFLLVCHILSAIAGLGAVMWGGIYDAQVKKRMDPSGRAILEANYTVTMITEYVRYAIFVFGILLVISSDKVIKFSNTFVWLSMLLFIAALGIAHAVMIPGMKKMKTLMLEIEQGPPPSSGPPVQVAQMEEVGKRLALFGGLLNVIIVVILALMIWKPGFGS